MRAHRRQFVIGHTPVLVDESWTSTSLRKGWHLSYEQSLPVAELRDRDGTQWHLLGIALQSDQGRPAPVDEIVSARTTEVEGLTPTWSGRWILLGEGVLRMDAASLLGCYYCRDADEGRLLLSSSPALLSVWCGGEPSPLLQHGRGMDWYPPPASRFDGIRRLLPSQVLYYEDVHAPVAHRRLVRARSDVSYDETLAFVASSIRTVLRNLASIRPALRLALTAGHDSRVLLAAASAERLDISAFTWDLPTMSAADRTMPALLSRDVGIPHRMIGRRTFDEGRLRILDEHTAGHTADLDRELVPWDQYAELGPAACIVLGNLFDVGALFFHARLPSTTDAYAAAVEEAFGFAQHHTGSAAHYRGLREWVAWVDAHPEPGMDWRDRFWWEQRAAGWCSAAEQGTDVAEVECISPVNSESVMGAILGLDPARRYGKGWQVDLTYRLAPSLADHPYYLGGSLRTRFGWAASGLRHHPSKLRFVTGRTRSLVNRVRSSTS
jgi:hypothetical protein